LHCLDDSILFVKDTTDNQALTSCQHNARNLRASILYHVRRDSAGNTRSPFGTGLISDITQKFKENNNTQTYKVEKELKIVLVFN
jgi:hypothetical protein